MQSENCDEDILNELENEEIPAYIQAARIDQMVKEAAKLRQMRDGYGAYSTIEVEKKFLDMTVSEPKCIVHFFHADFRRCAIIDMHLEKLAVKHWETRFARINVDHAKFFVEKLKIRILPAILCFIDGRIVDRITGFEELGNTDDFQTHVLEKRLAKSDVLKTENDDGDGDDTLKAASKIRSTDNNSDDDNDW